MRWTAHAETGQIGDILSAELLTPALLAAVKDPATKALLVDTLAEALQRDDVRAAARSYLAEGALWVAGGVAAGILVARIIRQ